MIKNLQVLRAIAALLVVLYHFEFLGVKVGFFGVDIFFIISGFIIAYVITKNKTAFLQRRFIRVIPMYYLVTFAISLLWFVKPTFFYNTIVNAEALIKSLLFIPYAIGNSGPILLSGWTLNYEMYFYLITGLAVILFNKQQLALLYASGFVLLIYLLQSFLPVHNSYLTFYGSSIVIEFVLGIILFFTFEKWKPVLVNNKKINLFMLVTAILMFSSMVYADYKNYETYRLLAFGIPSFFIVAYFLISDHFYNKDSKLYQLLFRLGNASYVMYLIHPFIIDIPGRIINPFFKINNSTIKGIEFILSIILLSFISDLIHRKVEKPVTKYLEKIIIPQKNNH
jgi:hypothetical protein